MTRELRRVAPDGDVLGALRAALAGGPALFVGSGGARDLPETVEQRIALVVETSGSTGRPKRVMLSADAVLASAAATESALGGPGQWVLAVPTHYIAGLNVLVRSIAAGIDPVFMGGDHFTPERFADAARRLSIPERFTALVPAQLAVLLDDRDGTSALRDFSTVLVGGQAAPRTVLDRAAEQGVHVIRTYGSTETCGGCVYDGSPIGMTGVDVVDGEVWLSGPTLAEGYVGRPDMTDERFPTRDGVRWFATNDEGSWDGEQLTVTGRRDDVIISGGVKVSLGEVERLIREHCGVQDAVVVAIPDAKWGEVPVIVTTADADFASGISAVGLEIRRAARPARVIRVEAMPMLPSGKVDRVAAAALAARAAE
jgi:O-succinylbenzoic acid--CoA ligase